MGKQLHSQLREFGLNPQEWILEMKSSTRELDHYEIWPVRDRGLHFSGCAHRGIWIMLQLVDHG